MLPFILFSTLLSPILTEPEEQQWVCNSSDATLSYSYCDNMKFPISVSSEPCISLRGTNGFLHIKFIPRRDLKKLYLNLSINVNSLEVPKRKEVICHGYDDSYSFCKALKGGLTTWCWPTNCGSFLGRLCLPLSETVDTKVPFSFRGILFSKGQYRCVAEAIVGDNEERLFCLNFTIIHYSKAN